MLRIKLALIHVPLNRCCDKHIVKFPLLVWEYLLGYFALENFDVSTSVRGGNLMWARLSGVVIWCEHECPGWSFDVATNVRGGHLMWPRMSGVVIWCEHECPALSKIAWERMSVGTNVRTPSADCIVKMFKIQAAEAKSPCRLWHFFTSWCVILILPSTIPSSLFKFWLQIV